MATSTFTQLLSSGSRLLLEVLLYVYKDHKGYQGREVQDTHLDFHTAPELRNSLFYFLCCFTSTETIRLITSIRDGEPKTATSTFTPQLLGSGTPQKLQQCPLYSEYLA